MSLGRSGINILHFGTPRTDASYDWRGAVRQLVQIAPVIVVDTRKPGPALDLEIALILKSDHREKAFFLVNEDGRGSAIGRAAPWLTAGLPSDRVVSCDAFVAWLEKRRFSPDLMPSRYRFGEPSEWSTPFG